MKVSLNYGEEKVNINIPEDELKKIIKQYKNTAGWKIPKKNEPLYSIESTFICDGKYLGLEDDWCKKLFIKANLFADKEFAEKIDKYQTYQRQIWRRITELCEPINWEDTKQRKWIICYDNVAKTLAVECFQALNWSGAFACDSKEHAERIMTEFKDQLTWMLTEFNGRS